ncbi:helix-turn-helix domain-containing protein [Cyanobium sp. Morenito 9A2]|uniref:helix-turn-helix domain-containing protein n=1 Tax=Cyanobium sp. Morenito 9A2 TaxID=2823718 RepID=UPI0020CD10A7|nr:helix-turn-helix domain-containing protein [Cyanobium sp. Morenito 9A2]MCP9848819.1 sigma-70 family RNA polymerase sigma factor [Cyanobium sp. Morenito 9A2]
MAVNRLSDSQKQHLVARYRDGESFQSLAEAYGCSPNTVSRVVKAALDPDTYAAIKQQRSRGAAAPETDQLAPVAVDPLPEPEPVTLTPDVLEDALDPSGEGGGDQHRVLAIDDADDFGDDGQDDPDLESDDEGEPFEANEFVTVAVDLTIEDRPPAAPQPLTADALPSSVYLLVDKTVELQARPLTDFPELGALSADESGRQALVVFANPRQAKRHCGRSQRVIKVPDSGVLERTAPYLLSQGISRLVLEGSLYALPGS